MKPLPTAAALLLFLGVGFTAHTGIAQTCDDLFRVENTLIDEDGQFVVRLGPKGLPLTLVTKEELIPPNVEMYAPQMRNGKLVEPRFHIDEVLEFTPDIYILALNLDAPLNSFGMPIETAWRPRRRSQIMILSLVPNGGIMQTIQSYEKYAPVSPTNKKMTGPTPAQMEDFGMDMWQPSTVRSLQIETRKDGSRVVTFEADYMISMDHTLDRSPIWLEQQRHFSRMVSDWKSARITIAPGKAPGAPWEIVKISPL